MKAIERKQIKGHPNYEIDTNGKVWNTITRQSVREYINPAGFSYVVLDRKIRTIAYLMKSAFFRSDLNICIRHRNGDRTDNRLANLYTYFDGSETLNPDGSEKKVIVMECNPQTNEVIKFWNTLREAADDCGVTTARIRRGQVVNGRKFDYYNAGIDDVGLFDYSDGNHIIQIYDEGGHLIGEATKLAEASEISGESINTVKHSLATDQPSLRKKYRYLRKLSTTLADDDIIDEEFDEDEEQPRKRARGVDQYDKKGKLIAHHKTVREASEATGVQDPNIRQCLNGVSTHAGGYVWRWEGEPFYKYAVTVSKPQPNEPKPKVKRDPRTYKRDTVSTVGKRLCQYDKDGNLIKTWENASQASKELGINLAQLGRAAKGKVKTAGGFYWGYEGEPFNKYARTATQQSIKRPLYQMKPAEDGNGYIILNEWDGVREAAAELGYPVASLAACAKKRAGKYKDGYYYSYSTF